MELGGGSRGGEARLLLQACVVWYVSLSPEAQPETQKQSLSVPCSQISEPRGVTPACSLCAVRVPGMGLGGPLARRTGLGIGLPKTCH